MKISHVREEIKRFMARPYVAPKQRTTYYSGHYYTSSACDRDDHGECLSATHCCCECHFMCGM
jgi:hypothetical protein